MRYSSVPALVLLVPAIALAEDGGRTDDLPPRVSSSNQAVIGGTAAPAGKWPDTVALLWGGDQACTGTLIAPNLVLTAGHCIAGDPPDSVLVGGGALSQPQEGEVISVMRAYEYPNSWQTVDAGVLVLAKEAAVAPRPIATGWPRFEIKNGAQVQLVGYGTTDRNGSRPTDSLMEAATTIVDFNCSMMPGCNTGARPDGELAAGGMGIDTCPGDSGGPVYLMTDYGAFVTGITSRAYDNAQVACSDGGIYGRPDKIIDWIEQMTSIEVARGPVPAAEPIMTVRGNAGETLIAHNDPKPGVEHVFEIAQAPGFGTAAVRGDGLVRVCARGDVAGDDVVIVSVSDKADPTRKLDVRIPIVIADGEPADDCDVNDFGDEGGCCDTRRSSSGSIPLALAVLLVLRRRRQ
jgi:hypothetical protein